MASLNLDLNYFDHVKTLRLAGRLGPGSEVIPIKLWTYAGKHHPEDGKLALLEAELEHICAWWGKKGEMVPALLEIGFLEKYDDFFQIHDWLDHSGHLAAFKKRAKNAAKKRWSHTPQSSNATSIAKSETKQCPSSAVHSSSVQSNPPNPLTTLPSASSTSPANGERHSQRENGTNPRAIDAKAREMLRKGTATPGHYDIPDDEIMGPEEFAKVKAGIGQSAPEVPQEVRTDDVF